MYVEKEGEGARDRQGKREIERDMCLCVSLRVSVCLCVPLCVSVCLCVSLCVSPGFDEEVRCWPLRSLASALPPPWSDFSENHQIIGLLDFFHATVTKIQYFEVKNQ